MCGMLQYKQIVLIHFQKNIIILYIHIIIIYQRRNYESKGW